MLVWYYFSAMHQKLTILNILITIRNANLDKLPLDLYEPLILYNKVIQSPHPQFESNPIEPKQQNHNFL